MTPYKLLKDRFNPSVVRQAIFTILKVKCEGMMAVKPDHDEDGLNIDAQLYFVRVAVLMTSGLLFLMLKRSIYI